MTYCTNCGKENSKKICPHCGVKRNATHKFCEWCGSEISEKASICTNCGENIKSGFGSKVRGVLKVICAILIYDSVTGCIYRAEAPVIPLLCFAIAFIMLLPFVKRIIKMFTLKKKGLRFALTTVKVILVLALIITGNMCIRYKVTPEVAKDRAVEFFHDEVKLKDESSFVLNDWDCFISEDPYQHDVNKQAVSVVLDYSARNGFGGMTRNAYTITMIHNKTNGTFLKVSSKSSKK